MPPVPLSEVAIHLRPSDNVAVVARNIAPGLEIEVDGRVLTADRRIGLGHKLAVRPIGAGEPIVKYGQTIGFATAHIPPGAHVHLHNVRADAFERDYAFGRDCPPPPTTPPEERTWLGYDRGASRPEHLRYGTRNYVAIISTVNCSASTSKYIAERLRA